MKLKREARNLKPNYLLYGNYKFSDIGKDVFLRRFNFQISILKPLIKDFKSHNDELKLLLELNIYSNVFKYRIIVLIEIKKMTKSKNLRG